MLIGLQLHCCSLVELLLVRHPLSSLIIWLNNLLCIALIVVFAGGFAIFVIDDVIFYAANCNLL